MPKQLLAPSPWLVGLLPWVIDLLFKTSFLNSFSGALLWGLLLVVYFAQARLKDPKLKQHLNTLLLMLSLLWLGGWFRALVHPIENPLKASESLYFMHGTFLMAASGMLFLVFGASIAGLMREKTISLPRDLAQSKKGFSLEGIIKLCEWSLSLARKFWLLGTFLAVIALTVQITHNHAQWGENFSHWLSDPAMWIVLSLALILALSKFFLHSNLKLRVLFKSYFYLSLAALLLVAFVLWIESSSAGHFQKEFLR